MPNGNVQVNFTADDRMSEVLDRTSERRRAESDALVKASKAIDMFSTVGFILYGMWLVALVVGLWVDGADDGAEWLVFVGFAHFVVYALMRWSFAIALVRARRHGGAS